MEVYDGDLIMWKIGSFVVCLGKWFWSILIGKCKRVLGCFFKNFGCENYSW